MGGTPIIAHAYLTLLYPFFTMRNYQYSLLSRVEAITQNEFLLTGRRIGRLRDKAGDNGSKMEGKGLLRQWSEEGCVDGPAAWNDQPHLWWRVQLRCNDHLHMVKTLHLPLPWNNKGNKGGDNETTEWRSNVISIMPYWLGSIRGWNYMRLQCYKWKESPGLWIMILIAGGFFLLFFHFFFPVISFPCVLCFEGHAHFTADEDGGGVMMAWTLDGDYMKNSVLGCPHNSLKEMDNEWRLIL